jgi:hypothetical protein
MHFLDVEGVRHSLVASDTYFTNIIFLVETKEPDLNSYR